jgi:hypothetical protein
MRRGRLLLSAAAGIVALPGAAWAQDDAEPAAAETVTAVTAGATVYNPADFERFAPKSALDMLNQIPGFSVNVTDQGRGLGQANANVIVNGERLASKSDDVFSQLGRITANRVERIEIVDGASLGIPGLSGQIANVVTKGGGVSGRFSYRMSARPKYAEPSYFGGDVTLNGSTSRLEWTLAYNHGTGRGAAGGPGTIHDALGNLTENRDVRIKFVGEFPRLSGSLKWDGPGSMVANFNANYSRSYSDFSNDEFRDLLVGVDAFRDSDNRTRGRGYEIGGDVDFALGPGRLKLIGLERFSHSNFRADSTLDYVDSTPTEGGRFAQQSDSGEHIGRAEYRWDMAGGNWQLDAEAAFNRLNQTAQLYTLGAADTFDEIPFPTGTGGVTEDRYEVILNHSRTLAPGLSLQFGAGAEYSKLAQTGPGGLIRTFKRPKGSATLSWTAGQGLDLSLKIARTVGQLSFGDFLASVNLAQNTGNAGNAELVPQQAWEVDFELRKNLKTWGSATLKLYGRRIDDYIDIIPVTGGFEANGNIDGKATLYGTTLNATINLDPIGFKGAKLDLYGKIEEANLADPLTGIDRAFSYHYDRSTSISLRHDIPGSDWAWGGGMQYDHVLPYYRLGEVGLDYEGPIYTWAFIEHKDVFGLTVNLNVFNLTDGRAIFERTVYGGYRDTAPVLFVERRNMSVQPIFQLRVSGTF